MEILGDNLLTLEGHAHSVQRRLCNNAFKLTSVQGKCGTINAFKLTSVQGKCVTINAFKLTSVQGKCVTTPLNCDIYLKLTYFWL